VAQDRAILAAHGISHVVNCVGALYLEYFKDDGVAYKTLWLQGEPFGRACRTGLAGKVLGQLGGGTSNIQACGYAAACLLMPHK
jgi:hypothetical protein